MKAPFLDSSFKLDVSGIAGFFGGEESFAAMSSVHLVRGRRWLGWYNSPGSYFVAKKYGVLARSRIWDGLYPGVNVDPTSLLELDGKEGPGFIAAHSGTRLPKTGHLSYLFAAHCDEHAGPISSYVAEEKMSDLFLTIAHVEKATEFEGYPKIPIDSFSALDPLAIIPIGYSVGASIVCAVFDDWFCFAMIMLGVFCNGISCVVIGAGVLKVKDTNPSSYSPPGDGILDTIGSRVILVKANEKTVQTLTKGKFFLEYESQSKYHDIGFSAVALTTQFLVQLFLIPQGTLFGQIMFLSSLGVSWLFNAYLASVDKEDLQRGIVTKVLLQKPDIRTVRLPKRTALVVFAATYMGTKSPRSFLNQMIPNDTDVWNLVKETIAEGILTNEDPQKVIEKKTKQLEALDQTQRGLLGDMLRQGTIGFNAAKDYMSKENTSKESQDTPEKLV